MKSLKVSKGFLIREVRVPPSKSYANRALILAAISKKSFTLENLPQATDVTFLVDCLRNLGLEISKTPQGISISNSFPECESSGKTLSVGEGGTTARFLATMLLTGKETYELILGERLKMRPWGEFITLVHKLGGRARLQDDRLILQGPIKLPETLAIDCHETTQFATAFQLLGLRHTLKVIPQRMTSSQSYWEMTLKLVNDLENATQYRVPEDWSSATYPLAYAAHNQEIFFPDLKFDPYQADAKFLGILESLGSIRHDRHGITVMPLKEHRPLHIDVSDCLDLVPTLGYFLGHLEGLHTLVGFENLIHKESDRLQEVMSLLNSFNRLAWVEGEKLHIQGSKEILGGPVPLNLPNDHRMVMAGTLFLLHHAGGSVTPFDAVSKSYPDFFEIIARPPV